MAPITRGPPFWERPKEHTDKERWVEIRQSFSNGLGSDFCEYEFDQLIASKKVESIEVPSLEKIVLTTPRIIRELYDEKGVMHRVFVAKTKIEVAVYTPAIAQWNKANKGLTARYTVYCLESGRYISAELPYYYYRPEHESYHGFCFGTRNLFVKSLLERGEFFQFFMSALDSLWHINENDIQTMIKYHRKLRKDGSLEPAQPETKKG